MAHATRDSVVLITPDEFLVYPISDEQAELVRGEVRVTPPPGGPHGRIATNVVGRLLAYVERHDLGWVFADGVGYELLQLPRTVRSPDASFVRAGRLPVEGIAPGFVKLAPDLAVEVLSRTESATDVEEKLDDYLTCGTALIWVIDPVRRTVMIVASDAPVRWLRETDTLDGGSVLPGFSCVVAELFKGVAR